MDLELGLKITKTRDDIASISEYRLAKAGPIFQSRETSTMFILSAHLKGYKRNKINIKISEDGSKISISGEKPVQNILMMGWLMHRKEVDVVGFNKVFKIPDGVKLDGIKAKYDEEEWTLNIFMPKLVKGICGVRIEEIKEESEKGRSELEKSEADQILGSVGETSQKGSKESNSKVDVMEDGESFMEKNEGGVSDKMLDDANREIIKEKIQKEVEESKLGTEEGNGESSGEKGGMEGYEGMKASELEQNVVGDTSQKIGDTSQKEIEESKLRIEDEGVKGMGGEVGKTAYEAVKTSEKENSVGEGMPHNIEDTSHDKELEVQEMEDNGGFVEEEKVVSEKMLDDANGNKIGEVIQKQIEESKSGIKDGDGESVKEKIGKAGYKGMKTSEIEQNIGAHVAQNIGDTSQEVSKEFDIEQMGEAKRTAGKIEREESGDMRVEVNVSTEGETLEESKQKQFGEEPKPETEDRLKESVKESSMELMKAPKLDQNIDDHIPSNICGTSQEFKKSRIQQKEKTKSIEENMEGRETGRMSVEASKDSQKCIFGDSMKKDIKKPKIETKDGDQEHDGEKAGKEEFDSMTIREVFPKQLPEATNEENKGLSASKMQDTENVKEAMIKRKLKEIDSFVYKNEGEGPRKMHMEAKKDLTKDVKEAMVKREGKEIKYVVDNSGDDERERMHIEAKKDLTKETTQEGEDLKEEMVKREGKEIDYFLDVDEDKNPRRMHMEANKDFTTDTMQETKDVKEVMVKRKDKEIQNFADEGEGEKPKRMHMKAKDLTQGRMQESEEVNEAIDKRKGKEIQHFVDKGNGEELISMKIEAKQDLTKEAMQESEDVKETMFKREGKEIDYFLDENEGEEPRRMHMRAKKDLITETVQDSEDVKEEMVKRNDKENENFAENGEGEEPRRMHMEVKKDLKKETVHKSELAKDIMVKRKDKEIDNFADKGEGEEPKRMYIEANKDLAKEIMKKGDVKELTVKRKDKEFDNFVDKGEGEEPKRILMETKNLKKETMQESEDVKEEIAKRKDKDIEYSVNKGKGEEPKRMMDVEAKNDLTIEAMKEAKDVTEVMVKRKDKEIKNFVDKSEGKEPKRMHMEAKEHLAKETMQENKDVKEAMFKEKGKETEYFVIKGEGEEPKRMHMKAKKDLTTNTMQESEYVKEAMGKRKCEEEIDYFFNEGEGEEPNRMHMEAKDITTEIMQESEDIKEATIKRKGKETEYFVGQGEGKEPKRIHTEAKKDFTKKTMQEVEYDSEAMVKRKGKEIDYFVNKSEGEELKRTHMEAKKDIAKETMQEEIEKIKNGIKDSDQQNVLEKTGKGKFEVPTEELPKLIGRPDGSRGLKVANMEEQKEMIKEEMVETKSSMEKVKGEKSNTTSKVTEKNMATEIIQKETEESNIERMSRDGPYVPNNMVKVVFEVLGTFQAKLPKQVIKAISQNKKEKNEYVIVKLKGEGSIKMHVEPNDAFDEDEIEDINQKEIGKPKLKSSDQISETDDVDVGVFDGSKRPKFPKMGETKDVKEDSAKIEESVEKVNEDKYEKIQVEEKGGMRKDTTGESTQTEREGSKIQTMEKDQHCLQETISKGIFEASTAAKEEFPVITVDSLADKRKGLKGKKIDEAKVAKEELVKQTSEEKKIIIKEKGSRIEQFVKKVQGEKYEMIQAEAKEGLRKDITKGKDQQGLQEGTSRGRYEANTTREKTLKPEIPLEKQIKKGEPITRKDEFAKGQKFRETIQEEIEGHKDKIDVSDQHVQRDVVKGVGKVDTIGKEMIKKEYVAHLGPVAKRMETKKDLKATPEKEKYTIAQNVKDEKPRIYEENIKVDVEKVDKKGYQTKVVEEGMLKGEHKAEVVLEIKTERPKVAKREETKEASKLPFKREMGKTIQSAEDRRPKTGEITSEFEKVIEFKQAVEKMHESHNGEHQRDSKEVTPKKEVKPPTITPEQGVEKSKKEDVSPMPMAIQRKEPHELSLPSKDYEIPKIEGVQQEKEGKRFTHALEAFTFKKEEKELAQISGTHSKAKGEIDEPQVNQLPSPSIEMWSKESRELEKNGIKEDDSKAKSLVNMQEGKKSIHSSEGTTTSEVVADEAAKPSKFSSSSSTQPFEVEGKDKIDASSDEESQVSNRDPEIDGQESTKSETDEEVEQRETLQPESPEDQQCINKDQEESHETHEIEEKVYEQVDEFDQEHSQLLEEQKECEEEATEGKKNDQKGSKKLFVSIIIAGSGLLASGIFLFIRHRRARKGGK
ncbi:centromere-associated protein E-like [Glycine soja]|uniref:SHSP domain-containing protein n=1 Tax=Glycine soja TaxID=3848 RepID=A0A445LL06_GLYSO|nr:centromere-associated protein E-like [Glycine soja]XP_028199670.1 centromere-associated protein E-like [Glycine soja]XP_028199677.1 centromere-associated protein E-like [Glycine soja]RZC23938.1 hypothetical protein D0Y65_003307 [Glycine soja]RZC23939.1 hypothetical protein D0Y65_003307 [Glycine soja]